MPEKGHNDMARGNDGEMSPLDEAAVMLHEMYMSFRRAGFTRTEATAIIAKTTAEIIASQTGDKSDET